MHLAYAIKREKLPEAEDIEDMGLPAPAVAYAELAIEYKLKGESMPDSDSSAFKTKYEQRLRDVRHRRDPNVTCGAGSDDEEDEDE